MNKRNLYTLIAILLLLGVYAYEFFLDEGIKANVVSEGKTVKEHTNTFFLPSSTTGQVIHHQGYSLSYNEPHEQAEWVAYELKQTHLSKSNFKRPYFEIDKAVKTGAAHWRNYKNSGYDRGHLCPAGDRRYSKMAHDETFLTSNISPQKHSFNSGIWNRLEQKVRYWADKYDGVFVITGGVLEDDLEAIGLERVSVPKRFYKILLDTDSDETKLLAFLLPHRESNQPLYNYVVTVDEIETLTGIDFFPKLEDTLENELESSKDYKAWSFY